MNALCFLTFLALASAAPQYGYYGHHHGGYPGYHPDHHHGPSPYNAPPPPPPPPTDFDISEGIFAGGVFDTRRFWSEIAAEMQRFDQLMNEFNKHFPTTSQAGVHGDEYVVIVNLSGFQENDIKVKAREGVLMVQAVHKSDDGSEQSYLDLKTLPTYVNANGSWTFDEGVLKIVFPLNSRPVESESGTGVETIQTEAPNVEEKDRDRENMEPNHSNTEVQDADVGIRGDQTKETELLTNVIPRENPAVEATTYAVDLKNEVEFVPVKY